ncbi:MAG: UDP-glucose/GDP-mannose dehydrogenase family protein [Deltaproteobacteria bacterium]|nr:UDP-glucose/GDP-mannose dehydrogenase family protein [Candidatus Zymogenaceae bacterium]
MKICIIGTGYVGLVTGSCFADMGNDVICVDKDEHKIEQLNAGEVTIFEPGLTDLVRRNHRKGRLLFSTDLTGSVKESLILFIAVGTPPDEDGSADLSHVLEVARDIGRAMDGYRIIVDKSTVPVGTADRVREIIGRETTHQFDVVSNPEFLKEGAAVEDFMRPERVIIGTGDVRVAEIMKELYGPFTRTGNPILIMDVRSAELTKYAANAFLATKISFMNEMANLCDRLGANIEWVRKGIGSDSRIGPKFLFPGVGFGGSCFPKDLAAIAETARENGYSLSILDAVLDVNRRQKSVLVGKVLDHFNGDITGKAFAVWGLSFKPNTDDIREAPSIEVVTALLEAGARVLVFDPVAMENFKTIFSDRVQYVDDAYDAVTGADGLLLVTEWNEFRNPDFERMKELMKTPVIFDGRNQYSRKEMKLMGFSYYCIGRPREV